MAYPYGIGPNPYVTSIWTSNLTQECMHKPFLRSPKNDLKKWVLEFVGLLQPEGEVGPTLLGQSTPLQILCACTSLDLRLTLCGSYLHSFLPCFSLKGNFTKVRSLPDL